MLLGFVWFAVAIGLIGSFLVNEVEVRRACRKLIREVDEV